jgi:hypothetical protein
MSVSLDVKRIWSYLHVNLHYRNVLNPILIHWFLHWFCRPKFNFALNKPTSQKTWPNAGWKAVDGNRNPAWSSGSCTQTQRRITDPQWWRVDLGEEIPVSRVVITNRGDCCGARLGNFAIKIGNSLDNDGLSNPTCAGDNLSVPTGQTKTFVCTPWIRGQYLVVQSYVNDLLTLCEVEVYAYTMEMIVWCAHVKISQLVNKSYKNAVILSSCYKVVTHNLLTNSWIAGR